MAKPNISIVLPPQHKARPKVIFHTNEEKIVNTIKTINFILTS